jgi:glycosyltransferase involved in cell wall biosynthesis
MPKCSIVIRSYNEEQHIGRLLTGILEQSVKDIEIILVDSGSSDATIAIASRFPVNVIEIAPQDFTFGRSLNVGCAAAKGQFIVISSAHVYPLYKDWLEKLLAPFEDPKVALSYGKQRGDQHTKFSEHQILQSWFPEESVSQQSHPFCNNANAAIRQSLWQIRPYDETLPGLEDLDWATWAMNSGHKIAYVGDAEIIHVHSEEPRDVYNRYRREAIAMKHIRPHERFHWWDFLRLYLSNSLSDLWYATREGVLIREWWGILWFRFMQLWGTYRGFSYAGQVTNQLIRTFYYPRNRERAGSSSNQLKDPIDYTIRISEQDEG